MGMGISVRFLGHPDYYRLQRALNAYLGCDWSGKPFRMAQIPAPAETDAFVDAPHFSGCGGARSIWANVCQAACAADKRQRRNPGNVRHLGGSILTFADGHAKWLPWSKLAQDCAKIYRPHNPRPDGKISFWEVFGPEHSM